MEGYYLSYSDTSELSKYRKLSKSGFEVHIAVGSISNVITLQGQKLSTKISQIKEEIQRICDIHPENQRIYSAGESLDSVKTFSECHITQECVLELKCFIPVLVSSLEFPGPMLTEVEVNPKFDDSIRKIKQRLSDKLGIDVSRQRLYLSPDDMTSFPRRRELDDISNLSRYLAPSAGNNFLELRPKIYSTTKDENTIIFRVPMTVQDARETNTNAIPTEETIDKNTNLMVLPHTHHNKEAQFWLSLELCTSKIIKRDPEITDILKLLQENLKPANTDNVINMTSEIRLKFFGNRLTQGGKYLEPNKKCSEDYQMRNLEQLLKVQIDGNENPDAASDPLVPLPSPLYPLQSYDDPEIRYTMPKNSIVMSRSLKGTEPLDLGAEPMVVIEPSAFSYSRLCGSWDIAEHYKTYVEILLEGTFYPGGKGLEEAIINNDFDTRENQIYYTQEAMEITIMGPENAIISNTKVVNKNPMKWYRKSDENREKNKPNHPTLDKRFEYAPFRYDRRPINMPNRVDVIRDVTPYDDEGISKLYAGNWYIGKERISDVTLRNNRHKIFTAQCEREETLAGNPCLKVTFKNRCPTLLCEENRKAFDFRIQVQFYICTLEDEFKNDEKKLNSKRFTINVRHDITRTKCVPGYSNVVTQFTTPSTGRMEATFTIDLANYKWLNKHVQH